MIAISTARSAVSLVLCGLGVSACFIDGSDDRILVLPGVSGTLTVSYTIEGTKDPVACVARGVTDVELIVSDRRGIFVTQRFAPCEAFEIGADLYPSDYRGEVTLVDPANNPVSLTLTLSPFEVVRDTELVIDVDFPAGSFLP